MRKLAIIAVLLIAFASGALAQSAPKWTAINPGTGFVACYRTNATAKDNSVQTIEVTATADLSFTAWRYYSTGWGGNKSWKVIENPKWGTAAADTVIFVKSGVTKSFKFDHPVNALYISAGDGIFQGE